VTAPNAAQARAAATYNAAADRYDDPANSFWERFGRSTIERLRPTTGSRILDVCCGSGASALPAAEAVGPRGVVVGIFFVPDMPAAVRSLWHAVRPGGRLAVTTWGPRFFEPATSAFWNAVREVRPDLYKGFNPWDRICDPESLRALLREGGIERAEVVAEAGEHAIPSPESWWSAVLGSGYRGTLEQLDPSARERVRDANLHYIRSSGIRSVEANVVYAIARKE
jgi:SAM-dependent methyltransferase